ncbi:hypothetical protein QTP70_003731 [Hemibagrus guttatus]|uniref:Chromo domain-containing protein n=1 Tax=Hemibagrus guttatus TaxID=175788 RepID=A0AAE0PWP6_9TELE|nr:hypothetical protein QTP70_003731 [Hemibagrus guttatus]
MLFLESIPQTQCQKNWNPILPPDLFVCPITWLLDDDFPAATEEEPAPLGGPEGEPSEVPIVDHLFRESERVWESAHVHLQQAVRRQKIQADVCRHDTPLYHLGDRVWISTRDICLQLPCKKLSPRYICPFTIRRQIYEVTYELQLPRQYRISPTFHVSLLKPFTDSVLPPSAEPEVPPPPEIDTDDTIYQVRQVVNSRRRGGRLQYLVDWEGYGPEERSWVDRDDILDPSLLEDFH